MFQKREHTIHWFLSGPESSVAHMTVFTRLARPVQLLFLLGLVISQLLYILIDLEHDAYGGIQLYSKK